MRKNLFKYTLFVSVLHMFFLWVILGSAEGSKDFMIGVNADNWDQQIGKSGFESALQSMGIQFIVWHISPEEEVSAKRLGDIVNFCKKNGWYYLFNTELVNYVPDVDYFRHSDGSYRWDIGQDTMERLAHDPLFLGVVYDEPMLMQSMNGQLINNHKVKPYFVNTLDSDSYQAYDQVVLKINSLNDYYQSYGKRLIFEMVFPDYAHAVARGGAFPAPKLLKENYNDLMFYLYSGAAIQYKQAELWGCVDLWFLDHFPGIEKHKKSHTPQELFDTLCYTYKKGFNFVYIEHVKGLMSKSFRLTEHGKKVIEFQQVKDKLERRRWYNIKPEHVIRRFPDGYWGQAYSGFIPDHPYGIKKRKILRLKKKSMEWLKLLNRLSDGKIPEDADNWNAVSHPYFRKTPYYSEAGLPEMLIFDHFFSSSERYPHSRFHDLAININGQ